MSDATSTGTNPKVSTSFPEEVLKPGALYSECAAVRLQVTLPESITKEHGAMEGNASDKEVKTLVDDGELGGELAGRLVWESFEKELKNWEADAPRPPQEHQTTSPG